jgi:hypothetical protein
MAIDKALVGLMQDALHITYQEILEQDFDFSVKAGSALNHSTHGVTLHLTPTDREDSGMTYVGHIVDKDGNGIPGMHIVVQCGDRTSLGMSDRFGWFSFFVAHAVTFQVRFLSRQECFLLDDTRSKQSNDHPVQVNKRAVMDVIAELSKGIAVETDSAMLDASAMLGAAVAIEETKRLLAINNGLPSVRIDHSRGRIHFVADASKFDCPFDLIAVVGFKDGIPIDCVLKPMIAIKGIFDEYIIMKVLREQSVRVEFYVELSDFRKLVHFDFIEQLDAICDPDRPPNARLKWLELRSKICA